MTYAELKAKLDTMTPEQLAMSVRWCGEDRGGKVVDLEVLAEDHVNPSGDGMESVSEMRRYLTEEEKMSPAEVEEAVAFESVVARAGQALLLVD